MTTPFGFVPIGTTDGSDYHGKMRDVIIDDTIATYVGDMMVNATNVAADLVKRVDSATGVAPAGDTFVGGLVEIFPDFTDEGSLISNFAPVSGGDRSGRIVYGSEVIYEAREDAVGELITGDEIGGSVDIITGTGSDITGISAMSLDSSTAAANLTQAMAILQKDQQIANVGSVGSVGALWQVTINPVA